jgi:excisionase family DNA binding protein
MKIQGYYTTEEAASILGVTAGRIRQLSTDGTFTGVQKVGNTNLIPVYEVDHYRPAPAGWPKDKPRKVK